MRPQAKQFVAEGVVAGVLGSACVAVQYADWWRECCEGANTILWYLFLPGTYFGMLIGGGPHAATRYHYFVGAALQLFLLWVGGRMLLAVLKRREVVRTNDA
jgi:hypothetical protein